MPSDERNEGWGGRVVRGHISTPLPTGTWGGLLASMAKQLRTPSARRQASSRPVPGIVVASLATSG